VGRVWVYSVAGATLLIALILAIAGVGEVAGALSNWQAFTLGLVQGATELLPISSSGHLILVPWLADWTYLEQHDSFNKTFDVALHLGTLVAVVAYFWHDIIDLLRALGRSITRRRIETREERIVWFVAVATIPAVAVGAATADLIDEHLGEPWQIAIFLAVFGVLLYIADRTPQRRSMGDLSLRQAVVMGFAQCLALMPGVSRSGITITAGRFMGLDRDSAARFSFLLLIPTVFGAVIYEGVRNVILGDLPAGWEGPFLVGTLAAVGSGLLAITGLLGYVRKHDYTPFVVYRLIVALIILLLIATGVRSATF
jgi:undecaprenyl-diphosphatase